MTTAEGAAANFCPTGRLVDGSEVVVAAGAALEAVGCAMEGAVVLNAAYMGFSAADTVVSVESGDLTRTAVGTQNAGRLALAAPSLIDSRPIPRL